MNRPQTSENPLPLLDLSNEQDRARYAQLLGRLAGSAGDNDKAQQVRAILEDVRQQGDDAVARYMRQWTDPAFDAAKIRVEPNVMRKALQGLDGELRAALERSIEHVRTYQQAMKPTDPPLVDIDGAKVGMRFTPMDRVGLHVPGGRASYPSSVIMLAVPAQVAGVGEIAVVCPPPTRAGEAEDAQADVSALVLATCALLGLNEVYRIGGAQAIGALAYGTATVPAVDFIAGPGNAYVQQAKRQVFGLLGIDGFYGPSEIVVLADGSADPAAVASDLLAQAEHDPGQCFVISTDRAVLESIIEHASRQCAQLNRRAAVQASLVNHSAAILAADDEQAYALVDQLAGEHVTLAVDNPSAALTHVRHGGAWFLGDATPVASGDYFAGPSHCLPTGTTARWSSGLSVHTFLKRSSIETYPRGLSSDTIRQIAALAEAEGLDAHAHSVRMRRKSSH